MIITKINTNLNMWCMQHRVNWLQIPINLWTGRSHLDDIKEKWFNILDWRLSVLLPSCPPLWAPQKCHFSTITASARRSFMQDTSSFFFTKMHKEEGGGGGVEKVLVASRTSSTSWCAAHLIYGGSQWCQQPAICPKWRLPQRWPGSVVWTWRLLLFERDMEGKALFANNRKAGVILIQALVFPSFVSRVDNVI